MMAENNSGFSLFEMLVVISTFALIGVLASQALILTMRGTLKSEALGQVRENVDYAVAVMERQLHNASEITDGDCDGSKKKNKINFQDQFGFDTSFSCKDVGDDGYIASSSARLTSQEVAVTSCYFVCSKDDTENTPPWVTINISAASSKGEGVGAGKMTTSTKVFLRTY